MFGIDDALLLGLLGGAAGGALLNRRNPLQGALMGAPLGLAGGSLLGPALGLGGTAAGSATAATTAPATASSLSTAPYGLITQEMVRNAPAFQSLAAQATPAVTATELAATTPSLAISPIAQAGRAGIAAQNIMAPNAIGAINPAMFRTMLLMNMIGNAMAPRRRW